MASTNDRLQILRLDRSDANNQASNTLGLQSASGRVRIPENYRRKKYINQQQAKRNRKGKQLGRKLGYAAHIWMMKQKQTHDKLVSSATSYVGNEVRIML